MTVAATSIVREKVRQATGLLREQDLPVWIAQFAQETDLHPEPVQDLVIGTSITWTSAFLIAADGRTVAIVGTGDLANIESVGAYDRVIGYVEDIRPMLLEVIAEIDPAHIGVSTSQDDFACDCITFGKYRQLEELLEGTPYAGRLVTAERVLGALRARKLPSELARIRTSIEATLSIFDEIEHHLRLGMTEAEMADFIHGRMSERGYDSAWDWNYDPVVNFGPRSAPGHAPPGTIALEPGYLVHVDLGLKLDGYCSDLQRMWYVLDHGQTEPAAEVSQAFQTLVDALESGRQTLRPGIAGWEVDAVARRILTDAGYEEPRFALGHQLGQNAHDGAGILGPKWPRYGKTPDYPIEKGSVFTLEFAVSTQLGVIGLEEDVVVTDEGAQYLCPPQTELKVLRLG